MRAAFCAWGCYILRVSAEFCACALNFALHFLLVSTGFWARMPRFGRECCSSRASAASYAQVLLGCSIFAFVFFLLSRECSLVGAGAAFCERALHFARELPHFGRECCILRVNAPFPVGDIHSARECFILRMSSAFRARVLHFCP